MKNLKEKLYNNKTKNIPIPIFTFRINKSDEFLEDFLAVAAVIIYNKLGYIKDRNNKLELITTLPRLYIHELSLDLDWGTIEFLQGEFPNIYKIYKDLKEKYLPQPAAS